MDYSPGSTGQMPVNLLVKESLVGDRGQSEIDFYELAKHEQGLPTFEYFGFLESSGSEPMSMLFNDLTATHVQTPWPVIPCFDQCRMAVDALAQIHGNWWGRLTDDQIPTQEILSKQIRQLEPFFSGYVDYVGDYFTDRHRKIYDLIFTNLSRIKADRAHVATLVHTDPHYWNFLYRENTAVDHCVIFDWPLWRFGFGGDDLAYMIALHLYREHRTRFEHGLLTSYVKCLNANDITYLMEDALLDYKLGVINGLLMPLQEFAWKIPPLDWLPKLEKAMSAFDDHDCLALLDS